MTQGSDQHGTDLREYLRVLRARKWEVLVVAVVVVAATMFFTVRQTPIYEGQTRILVKPVVNPTTTISVPQQPNLDTERELIHSQLVAEQVRRDLELSTPVDALLANLKVEVITDTEVLLVEYDSPSPATAARLANAFASAYVSFRARQAEAQFTAASGAVRHQIEDIQHTLSTIDGKIAGTTDTGERDTLQSQRDALVAQLGVLQQRLSDLTSNAGVALSSSQVVQRAETPASPVSPDVVRNGILALLAGLGLGIGFAFLRERLDDRVKSRLEVERRLGAPVLAAVPRVSGWRRNDEAQLVMRSDPKSPVSESYRTLGTNVQYLASRRGLRVVMLTSAIGGDGKSTTSSNLAVVLAQAGKRVVLISADLRRPRLHQFFGLQNTRGLSEILAGRATVAEVAVDPGIPNLRLINAGAVPQDPAALLGSPLARDFFQRARDLAEFVLIDTPPVLAVADASILSPMVDGTVFVLDAARSGRSAMLQARNQLETAGAQIIGAVYNNFDPNASAAYPYSYRYYYQYYGDEGDRANGNGSGSRRGRGRGLLKPAR